MSRPEAGLEELRNAFDRAVYGAERRAWIIGLMGMQNTDGTMSLAVPDRLGFVFVTTGPSGNQIVTIARNDGKVPLRNKMPIRMKRADDGVLVIYGVFNSGGFTDSGMSGDYDNNFGVEQHNHRIGTGLEFEWEALMLEQSRAYPTSGMLAYMNPFRYYHGGEWKTYEGGTFDLTGYQPGSVGTHAWVIIGVNPEDSSAVAVTGPSIPVATDLTLTDVNAVDFVGIPVVAIKVRNDSSSIQDITLFKDVHEWFAGLHYSELGDLGNVNTGTPYFNDELYYHGDGYDWVSGGHKVNMGVVKQLTLVDGVIDLADGPTFGIIDLIGEGSSDDVLTNILNGQIGDMIVLHVSNPVANGIITIVANANFNIPNSIHLETTSTVAILMLTASGWVQSLNTPVDYVDYRLTFDGDHQEGRVHWNPADGTLNVGMPGGIVELQLGQEMLIRCRNETGVLIPNGAVVYASGASGSKPLIDLADSTDPTKLAVLGMATEDIAHNDNGYVNSNGFVRDVNTDGMTIGLPVFLDESTPGGFTQTRPTAPNYIWIMGIVIAAHATEGVVYNAPTPGHVLMSMSDVFTEVPADGEFLIWNDANARFELGSAVDHALTDHTDVVITAPAENDTVHYDGANWINKVGHRLNMQDRVTLVISGGAIDITGNKTEGYFDIRGEADSNDELDIITGGNVGDIIHLSTYAPTSYGGITVTNNNNIQVPFTDILLNSTSDGLTLINTTWGWFPISIDKRLDGSTVTVSKSFETYIDVRQRFTEQNFHGGIDLLLAGEALDSTPDNIDAATGVSKLLLVLHAGSDVSGSINVSGTSVDRDTGDETALDSEVITVDTLTTDASGTDSNGNITHDFTDAYITSKWYTGTVQFSTADLTLTDVDVWQVTFEQFNDEPTVVIKTLDFTAQAMHGDAWVNLHLYTVKPTTGSKCDIDLVETVGRDASEVTINKRYRLRRGDIDEAIDGTTEGVWLDMFMGRDAQPDWEAINIKLWYEHTFNITPGV